MYQIRVGPHEAVCECGCKKVEVRSRMKWMEARNHLRFEGGHEEQNVQRRWFVRKLCEPHFIQELNIMMSMNRLATLLAAASWWRRLASARELYTGMVFMAERRDGKRKARIQARRFTFLVIAPDWLARAVTAVTKKWNAWKAARRSAAPKAHPEPSSVTPPAPC